MKLPYATIGDCHLGKEFKAGVPLNRIGEREYLVMQEFEAAMRSSATLADNVVQVGDLFNAFVVKNNVVQETFLAILDTALTFKNTTFWFYNGNHDLSKDTSLTSSFELLAQMKLPPNVKFLVGEPAVVKFGELDVAILPWNPVSSACAQAVKVHQNYQEQPSFDVVFGHWDTVDFGNDFNYVPVNHIEASVYITGHEHVKGVKTIAGKKVVITGSLQPFSHAEDPEGNQYKTVTLEEALQLDPESVKHLNLRVILKGDETPEGLNLQCLSLTFKKVEADEIEAQDLEAIEHGFDVMKIFKGALSAEALEWVNAQGE